MELVVDGGVDVAAVGFDGLEVEPGRRDHAAGYTEDDHTAKQVRYAVTTSAGVLGLDPDPVAVGRHAGHGRPQVRYRGQDLRPVTADLIVSDEAARWVYW